MAEASNGLMDTSLWLQSLSDFSEAEFGVALEDCKVENFLLTAALEPRACFFVLCLQSDLSPPKTLVYS